MNRLRNIVGLIAVCATAAFFTGCGEDDHADNGGNQPNAPASLAGRTYNLADAGGNTVVAFDANGTAYTLTPSGGGAVETGSFTGNQSGDVHTVSLVGNGASTNSTLTLTFTAPGTGTYTFDRPGEPLVSGNFSEQAPTTDGPPPTTDGGTDGGTGTVQAPATLQTITITPANGITQGQTFTVALNNGNFTATGSDNQAMGSGTYTYAPNGTTADLQLNYSGADGDFDLFHLIFTQQQGSGAANNFTGTQRVSGGDTAIHGTFIY